MGTKSKVSVSRDGGCIVFGDCYEQESSEEVRQRARNIGKRVALGITTPFTSNTIADGPIDVVDFFCGCGGISTGFEAIGKITPSFRLAGAVDINKWAIKTYSSNLPITPLEADIMRLASSPEEIDHFLQSLNLRQDSLKILVGGPPCQGFSAHRKKAGKPEDVRNDLVRAFARIAVRMRPDIVVMENVPEILAKKHFRQFEGFREVMESEGYTVQAQIHNLATFGVPQERFRALVIASRLPIEMPEGFLDPDAFRTVQDAIGHLPPVMPGSFCETDPYHYCTRHRSSTIEVIRQVPHDGGNRPAGIGPACLDRVDGFRDVYGRLPWRRPANTITAYARNPASGRYVHPEQDRGLTIREAALLQGFPSTFSFEGPFDDKYVQIGNAVPPAFAAYLAGHLLGELAMCRKAGYGLCTSDTKIVADTIDISPTSDSFSSGIAGRKRGKQRAWSVTLQ